MVAHYVDEKWNIEKRIIGFKLIDVSQIGENIASSVVKLVEDFSPMNKIFAITLDKASSNIIAMIVVLHLSYRINFVLAI